MTTSRLPYGGSPPDSWAVVPLKYLATLTNGYVFNSADWVDAGTPIIRIENLNGSRKFNHSGSILPGRYRVKSGDLLFSWSGNPGTSFGPYLWSDPGDYYLNQHIFKMGVSGCDARWLYWSLKAATHWIERELTSGMIGMVHVTKEELAAVPIPVPPIELQRRIADFLDAETARIDNLSGLGERQVNLLRERSEAEVVQFFGPGDGRREYRFRHLMESNPCYGVLVPKFADVGVPLIRVSDLGRLDHDLERLPKIEEEQAKEYKRTCISPGDLLITVVGATIGRCDVAPPETAGFNVSRALARVQLMAGIEPQMIASWVRGRDFRIQAELATSGAAAQPALNMSDITHFTVWLPETHSGRLDLSRRVSTHEDEIRRLLSAIKRKQALIAERRQSLITAAVTGQFDVSTASGRNVTDGVTA
ncbi:restriction endonuclease subunit S [Streptomyces sp. NPDC046915]|uniref:restriction endonuclease subunit S n=1 Tax=Streptomyces sp. NPDC046915 TaxID=3155257 RepID=UPI00340504C3